MRAVRRETRDGRSETFPLKLSFRTSIFFQNGKFPPPNKRRRYKKHGNIIKQTEKKAKQKTLTIEVLTPK